MCPPPQKANGPGTSQSAHGQCCKVEGARPRHPHHNKRCHPGSIQQSGAIEKGPAARRANREWSTIPGHKASRRNPRRGGRVLIQDTLPRPTPPSEQCRKVPAKEVANFILPILLTVSSLRSHYQQRKASRTRVEAGVNKVWRHLEGRESPGPAKHAMV